MVKLQHANLLQDLSGLGKFDAVFCRNVLIYFEAPTKSEVLGRIRAMMPDDGHLFLGAAETVVGISDSFKTIPGERGVYATDTATAATAAATAAAAVVPKPAAAPPITKSA